MHRPERTCVGCRGKAHKPDLLRLVRVLSEAADSSLAVDLDQSAPGRGAYLHRDPDCWTAAVRRRALGRALRAPAPDLEQLLQLVAPQPSAPPA